MTTYNRDFDYSRLTNNLQRVFWLLLDGEWHTPNELMEVGGAQWSRRVRSLREPRFGMRVTAERCGTGGTWRYRLDKSTVQPNILDAIMTGNVEPVRKDRKVSIVDKVIEILNDPTYRDMPRLALNQIAVAIEQEQRRE